MNKTLTLTRILLKNGSGSTNSLGKKKLSRSAIIILITLVACIPLILSIGSMIVELFDVLKGINQQGIILAAAMPMAVIVIFFFGIAYTINTFYFSRDIEMLLPLPLKQSEILGAKFATVLVYEYITEAAILLPVLSVYGVKNQEPISYYIYSIIVFLILPVIPLIAASIIDMIIMRFTNIAKNKDLFRIAGGTLAMFIALGANMYFQRFSTSMENSGNIAELLNKGNNSMIGAMSSLFPSTKTAVYALVNSSNSQGLFNILSFFGITALAFAVFIVLGNLLYFQGVMGISETASRRRLLDHSELSKKTKSSSEIYSYMLKELKLLFRTPVYFLNCILMNFLWPVFLLIPFFAKSNTSNELAGMLPYIQNRDAEPMVLAAAFVIGVFITASNMISSTAISREGKNIFFMKYIPVDYEKQLVGKAMSSAVMGFAGIIIIVPIAIFIFKIRASVVILAFLVSMFGTLFSALSGIIIDVSMPKLNWDTEQKAVKQNFNGMISIFGSFALGALVIFLTQKFNHGLIVEAIALVSVFGIINCILYKVIKGYCVNKLKAMDV